MGVTGLWRLIEPAGKPVPVETLENKVLARLCKLLYFRVKPVFVFDGGFPDLKRETINKRQDHKTKYNSESERIKRELALILSKKMAISSLLGKQLSPKKNAAGTSKPSADDDLFKLPTLPARDESESESEDEDSSSSSIIDLHSIDVESENFKQLPVKEKYNLLLDLKETRKMNSWGKLHELPKQSDNFSDFQMQRLLKRRKVQECLEETEKEMGDGGMSLNELESLLNEEGIDTKIEALPTRRIASNNTTRFLLINNVKQAIEDAKKKKLEGNKISVETVANKTEKYETNIEKIDELEDDLQKAIKMSLQCVDDGNAYASTSNDLDSSTYTSKTDDSWTSYLSGSENSHCDSDEDDGFEQPDMTSAKSYIMQYSDFTHNAIDQIVSVRNKNNQNKRKGQKIDKIIEELHKEKSIIAEKLELSSGDEGEVKNNNSPNVNLKIEPDSCDEDILESEINEGTQSSLMIIENPTQEIVCLDTSAEDNIEERLTYTVTKSSDSSDNDDEFEEVPEVNNAVSKTVVELTLNVVDKLEDDIFADVFTSHKDSNFKINESKSGKPQPDINVSNQIMNNVLHENIATNTKIDGHNSSDDFKQNHNKSAEIDTVKNPTISKSIHISNIQHELHNVKDFDAPVHTKISANATVKNSSQDLSKLIGVHVKDNIGNEIAVHKNIQPKEVSPALSKEQLHSMVNEIENVEQDLIQEKGRLDRVGRNITEQMTKEAQELLQIFGIPYIIAPMEAEAQCAFLEAINLTDGTITDDSDIWLFGGKTVYKNFFNQKKHVLQFLSERIEKSFNLTREHLVLLALLVGSDYTTGLNGVGPVTALEILASFPFNKKKFLNESTQQGRYQEVITGLQDFKKWVRTGKRTDNTTLKKKLKNVEVSEDFPSIRVVQAYLDPKIEKSEESFTWGEMDITVLRDYTRAKFGWSQNKLDEIIKPVMKRLEERKSQKNIQDYFKKKVDFRSLDEHLSKRVKDAVHKMGPDGTLHTESTDVTINKKTAKKRKTKGDKNSQGTSADCAIPGPSKSKQRKSNETTVLDDLGVKVVSKVREGKSTIEITIPKTDRVQEIIPQREKDKQSLLQNKMKAIEIFRKSNIDQKKKNTKRRVVLPKEKADLSESDSD
ncbi:DNA excision repair protein ERCC-5 homolog isoform X2 [Plodia interpunctella]|uniref:DNA excision repair protein ERCC-5 homolog isoform X2 n=1 Tax=Plodia interpunctella TaxID=58824 RepID=UPI0023676006|nr:DNA excision repair protein ERCC-5 homolog isoform X2 [Plodia interpunctella]